MGKILKLLFAGIAAVIMHGCNTTGCVDNQSSIPLAGFYSYETLGAISLSNISVGGVDAPNDSLLLDHATAPEVYLPFRSLHEETRFFIRYEDTGEPDPDPDEGDNPDNPENPDNPDDPDNPEEGEEGGDEPSLAAMRAVPAVGDTLSFKYERIPYFASEDCGAMYRYRVVEMTYTRNMIDSVAMVDSMITNVNRRTIEIYFRTQTDTPEPES